MSIGAVVWESGALRGDFCMRALVLLPLLLPVLSACAVYSVGSAAVGAATSVATTTVDAAGSVAGTAVDTVSGGGEDKKR